MPFRVLLLLSGLLGLTLLWAYTPLSRYFAPEVVVPWVAAWSAAPYAWFAALGLYALGCLLFVPQMAMMSAAVLVFPPLESVAIILGGSLLSGVPTFAAGRVLGAPVLRMLTGPAAVRIAHYAERGGVLGLSILRALPVAPFTVVNLVLGMAGIRLGVFLLATFFGLLPGAVVSGCLGSYALATWRNPHMGHVVGLLGALVLWLVLLMGIRRLTRRYSL